MSIREPRSLLLLAAVAWLGAQDPERSPPPPPPEDARPLPPVQDPPTTPVERRDLLQRFDGPSPLAGFYRLRAFDTGEPGARPRAEGYLAVGRDHLSIHLLAPREGGPPAFQSAFRRYRISGDTVVTTSLIGLRNDADGDVLVDAPGLSAVRRFELVGTRLTLYGEGGRKLEFERIE